MSRMRNGALAITLLAGGLTMSAASQGGLLERWRGTQPSPGAETVELQDARSGSVTIISEDLAQAPGSPGQAGGGGGLVPGTARGGAMGQATPGNAPGSTTTGGGQAGAGTSGGGPSSDAAQGPSSPGQAGGGGGLVPGTGRSGAMGQATQGAAPGSTAGAGGPADQAAKAGAGDKAAETPAASGCHNVVVEVPVGICCKKKICVHCRGCCPGQLVKVCGKLPCCVKCEPRKFRVTNPLNGCPVDVTACLPDTPEKAKKVDKDPYYITYHYENCRITIWFYCERNNNYVVQYAGEKPT